MPVGCGAVHMEPLGPPFPFQPHGGFQIGVKIVVGEIFPGAVLENGVVLPGQLILDAGGVGLLLDALGDGLLLGVADLRPALVVADAGSVVGVDHGDDTGKRLNFCNFHHVISFTWVSINWISVLSRPYFL